ncbi:receptor-type tyrosine-protein phosphatase eta-like isoform X2 [Crassostrea angulata]|uniref:receptor-type tyrosine-protein phosphatase eta-like isoform X2 n=1 Tax=Magallana angulata TaxID=2784310 RepID=UPI0022B15ACE|nr:receptor-type tyrosine-protein phosphatase eta-like isoform X2 [Crassostrea angulata]
MSWTVGILIVSWLCIFSVSGATLGESCIVTENCTATVEICTDGNCECNSGYFNVSDVCKSSSITVSLSAQSTSVVYGSEVVLTASITSEVPLNLSNTIKWLKGQTGGSLTEFELTPSKYTQNDVSPGQVTLTIQSVNFNDTRTYQVKVGNIAGVTSNSNQVSLTVTGEKPTVTVPRTIAETDTTVTIHCIVSLSQESPALTSVYWLLNGTNLNITNYAKYSGGTVSNPSLSINNIASADAGEYHCGATNLVGSSISSQSVTLAPPSNVHISASQSVDPIYNGSSITITGSFSSNLSTENKWQKQIGAEFTDIDITDGRYAGSSLASPTPKLVITKVDFIGRTSFRLVVTNRVGFNQSEPIVLNVVDGSILVTLTPPLISVKYGEDVTLTATIESPATVTNIKWQKVSGGSTSDLDINLDKYTQTDSGSGTVTLMIKNVVFTDSGNYRVQVSNAAGTIKTSNQVSLNVKALEYNDNCINTVSCDSSKQLECSNNKCLCVSNYYHKEQVCYAKSRLAPTITSITSTTSSFSVFWNPPNIDSELVTEYEVKWKVPGSSDESSGRVNKTVNSLTVSSGLMSGQLYTVYVISHGDLTNPAKVFVVTSNDSQVRLDSRSPGPILNESNFTHTALRIIWTAPDNTFVTRYEVTIESDDATYVTSSNSITLAQFNGKSFTPGAYYNVRIVTVSGETLVKRSPARAEEIRIIPTQPGPPINVRCPDSPLDVSLHMTWRAPTNPNGVIQSYLIAVSSRIPSNINTSSNITNKIVDGLLPEQTYTFTVRTVNDADESIRISEPSQKVSCKTRAGVSSSPTNLVLDEVESRKFMIKFGHPSNVNGVLAGYKILILQGQECIQQILVFETPLCDLCVNTSSGCTNLTNENVANITLPVSYTATGLNPYTTYFVRVTAINGVGEGHPVNATRMTDQEVPTQPEQINASNINSKNLTLSWNLPKPSPGDTTYTIYVEEATDDKGTDYTLLKTLKNHGFENQSVPVIGLEEYWQYRFKVDASTVKGNATSNISSTIRTKQGAPGQVVGLSVQRKETDYRTAYASWSLPALMDRNGVLKSYLFSNNHTGEMKTEEINVSLTVEKSFPVEPENIYAVEVILINTENMESVASRHIYQASPGPPDVSNIEPIATKPGEHIKTQNTITLEINKEYFRNDLNGKQVLFGIAVCAESKCQDMDPNTRDNDWKNLPTWHEAKDKGFPLYRATNESYMEMIKKFNDTRRKRSTTNPSLLEYKIGEDSVCPQLERNVHCNGPLNPGNQYKVIIFACTRGGCTHTDLMGPYATTKIPEEPDSKLAIIIGACVAVVVFLVVVGVVVVILRRRNRLGETKKYTKGIDNQITIDEPVAKNIPRKRPIKLKELSDKVAEKHKDSNLHFAREYEDLKALSPKHPAETSELDNNKLKNRYVNILPFDHSRVKLMLTEDDDPSTDFINANYLPGYKSQREYIATQGPIPGTIDDFWRMIWEQNVSIIVMLTLCKEEGRVKCEMYWPENIHEPKQYGDLVVETVSNSTVNFYEFRIFKIKLGDTTRSVKHFHFLQWKDFSANVQNDVMIDFIKNVRNHIRPPDMNGPVVVHCSAGVGRTGTYCALDHLFQFVDEHDLDESIDIFDLVMNLRERRMFMVQTEQQYIFIHDCLKDYLEKKLAKDECLYENQAFVADDEPVEESLYQNYSNQRTDL